MDRLRTIEVFVKVAERGGFAAAARDLAMSPAVASRAVAALEQRVGARLFVRTTRSVRLTENGERFLWDCKRILAELAEAEEAAGGGQAPPHGELTVTAPVLFGRMHVAPILADFLDCYPLVTCQTLFVDRIVNLLDEGLDAAVRIGDLPDSSLVARRVGWVRRVVVATPDYLRRHPRPHHPSALAGHPTIQALPVDAGAEWRFQEDGVPLSVRLAPRVRMNTNDGALELVLAGWGVSRFMSYQVAAYLADGTLQRLLQPYELPAMPVHVLHKEGRLVSKKVRTFVDYAVQRLRANRAINQGEPGEASQP